MVAIFHRGGGKTLSLEQAASCITQSGEVIVKDAWDSGEGRGVKKYFLDDEVSALKLLHEWISNNFLIQRVVKQHPILAQFNESSLNVIRINTWLHEGKVEVLNCTLRFGIPGTATDITTLDGEEIVNVVAISKEGKLAHISYNQFGQIRDISDQLIAGDQIPMWDEIINITKKAHLQLPHFCIVGWDMTVTPENEVVCIEYNIKRPGTVFYQYANGPFFGEYMDEVMSFLEDHSNQVKYVPKWMRV